MQLDGNMTRNLRVWDFSHLVIATDAALAVQSGALHKEDTSGFVVTQLLVTSV